MTDLHLTLLLFLTFLGLLALRVPVAFSLGLSALTYFLAADVPALSLVQKVCSQLSEPTLLAIPFFILCGEIMTAGGMARRLVDLASVLIGFVRGGLAMVNILASMFFGGISGSSVADTASIGSLMVPMMSSRGYRRDFSVAVTISSSTQGIIIPPSHNAILFCLAAGGAVSIQSLFLAGYLPGLLIGLSLMLLAYAIARRDGLPAEPKVPVPAALRIARGAIPALITPALIIVPISAGWIPAQAAAALAVAWSALVSTFLYRSLAVRAYGEVLRRTLRTSSLVLILIGTAAAFGEAMTLLHVPGRLTAALTAVPGPVWLQILLLNLLILGLGTIMDMAPLIVILTPILLPVATELGLDPVQFGVVLLLNLGIGLCTPPVGSTLFVGCAVGEVSIESATRALWPFYWVMIGVLLLVTFIPAISLVVPAWFG